MDSDCKIDRISQLPDSLLYEILSHLPTKNVIATCILSTRWNQLTPFAVSPNQLVFDDSHLLNPENELIFTSFMHFVDKLLNHMLVSKFRVPYVTIRCRKRFSTAKFVSWLRAALEMNVEHLLLNVPLVGWNNLFCYLGDCKTLTRLELGEMIMIKLELSENVGNRFSFPDSFMLSNLKSLRLCGVIFGYADELVMDALIKRCPVLLDLHFSNCDFRSSKLLMIESRSLKNLLLTENTWPESYVAIKLDAPSLQLLLFSLKNCLAADFWITNLSSLNLAFIDVDPNQQMGQVPLVQMNYLVSSCFSASRLYLNHWAIEGLYGKYQSEQLPEYHNLTFLSLGCVRETDGWKALASLLCNAPNLKTLALREGFKKCKDGYATFESFVSTTPVCLELHLKEIDIMISDDDDDDDEDEDEDEVKLIEYFLKNGKVIETIHIQCTSNWDGLARLRSLSGGSKIHLVMDWELNADILNQQISSFDW